MEQNCRPKYVFGPFLLDPVERLLFSHGQAVSLTPKAFETLVVLVERNGRLVTKDELLRQVWPNAFVEEAALAKNIFIIRKALGQQSDGPVFIETVPKQGYRFVLSVERRESNGVEAPAANADPQKSLNTAENLHEAKRDAHLQDSPVLIQDLPHSPARPQMLQISLMVGVFFVAILSFLLLHKMRAARQTSAAVPRHIQSLAVLPLANLSGDPSQDYFADGMTDELITVLTQLHSVQVMSRTSAMRYRNSSKPLPQIAQELHVDAIVEGAVVRSGDRVRVTAQLIEGATDRHLWAASYDRPINDALAIQSDVAREIARQIQIEITPTEDARLRRNTSPLDPEVQEEYLLGRYYWNKRNEIDLKQAIKHFERAISLDPHYAPAHAGLADSYLVLMLVSSYSAREAVVRAQAAAQEALRLDDSLGEAHTSLAYSRQYDWDFNGAEQEYQRAIQLSPGYATAHQWYGEFLTYTNRTPEALEQYRLAMKLDPLSPVIHMEAALPYWYVGRDDEALQKLHDALGIDPNFAITHGQIARILEDEGHYQQALAELQQAEKDGLAGAPWIQATYCASYAGMGDKRRARACLEQLKSLARRSDEPTLEVAGLLFTLGENDQAMKWFERGYRQHNYALIGFGGHVHDPKLVRLFQDPRFKDLIRRIGFPPSVTDALRSSTS